MRIFFTLLFSILTLQCFPSELFRIKYNFGYSLPNEIDTSISKIISKEKLLKLSHNNPEHYPFYTITNLGLDTIAVRSGFFDVYKWQDTGWVNLYKGIYGGYNFGNYIFTSNATLLSYGGYGYWESNNNLLRFNPLTGGWDKVAEVPGSLIYNCIPIYNNGFLKLIGGYRKVNGKVVVEDSIHTFSLLSNTWSSEHILNGFISEENNIYSDYSYHLGNFVIAPLYLPNKSQLLIIDADNNLLLRNKIELNNIMNSVLILTTTNSFRYQLPSGNSLFYTINELLKDATPLLTKVVESPVNNNKTKPAMGLLILPIIGGIYMIYRKKKRKKPEIHKTIITSETDSSAEIEEKGEQLYIDYYKRLSSYENKIITVDQLNEILELDKIENGDTLRAYRSKKVKDINSYSVKINHYKYIHSVKDEKDKRYVNYWIGKKEAN